MAKSTPWHLITQPTLLEIMGRGLYKSKLRSMSVIQIKYYKNEAKFTRSRRGANYNKLQVADKKTIQTINIIDCKQARVNVTGHRPGLKIRIPAVQHFRHHRTRGYENYVH